VYSSDVDAKQLYAEPSPEDLQQRGFTFVQGVGILKFNKTPLIYSVSNFNLGAWRFV